MATRDFQKTATILFVLIFVQVVSGTSGQARQQSQGMGERAEVGDRPASKTSELGGDSLGDDDRHTSQGGPSVLSSPDSGAKSDDDDEADDDDDGVVKDEGRVEFTAMVSKQWNLRQQTRNGRRHQETVKFDTTTATPHHNYNPLTSTFTAPVDGLYVFSVRFKLRPTSQLHDLHVRTDNPTNIVCSIIAAALHSVSANTALHSVSANTGFDSVSASTGLDSVSASTHENNGHDHGRMDSARWDFEAEFNRLRRNSIMGWSQPPESVWVLNEGRVEAEGFCEGVKHLRQGQQVFVTRGHLEDDDDDDDNSHDKDAGLGDIVDGFFSGSLLTRDWPV
ncbi:uncharacterized protein LOC143287301 [Babylonia areolata]|uniref:uncharacterized protein LOC143287301 n=1 Tax=Babylonia areolata TaxID=304850 RepID=UPI003FD692B5